MKYLRKQVLSVLLLAFAFFMVHDYCIDHTSDSIQEKVYALSDETNLLTDIHDNIHTMFEVNLKAITLPEVTACDNKSLRYEYILLSYLVFPLDKPPVI